MEAHGFYVTYECLIFLCMWFCRCYESQTYCRGKSEPASKFLERSSESLQPETEKKYKENCLNHWAIVLLLECSENVIDQPDMNKNLTKLMLDCFVLFKCTTQTVHFSLLLIRTLECSMSWKSTSLTERTWSPSCRPALWASESGTTYQHTHTHTHTKICQTF